MSKTERYLPFILASIVPGWGILSTNINVEGYDWSLFVLTYLQVAFFILVMWYLNQWLLNTDNKVKKRLGLNFFILVGNFVFIASISVIDSFIFPIGVAKAAPPWLLIVRMSLMVVIFNVILRVFKSQKERATLKFQNLSLQAENLKFQIDTLKQQINPHFLFNSLNTLLDLVEDDSVAAAKYVRNFSNLYRVVLQSAKHDFVPLSDELKFLDDYWNLLKVRFGPSIDLEMHIDEAQLDHLIPPLCLQFLIENAVKHNEATTKSPLKIKISYVDNHLVVKNKLQAKSYPIASEKVGLKNLQQRFTLLYHPIQYGVEEQDFVVRIPLKNS